MLVVITNWLFTYLVVTLSYNKNMQIYEEIGCLSYYNVDLILL